MIALGIIHISMLLIAYILYFFITINSFSNKINYRLLFFANMLYLVGFILGMFWAKIDWGFYFSLDIKYILTILVFFPFLIENIIKKNKPFLPVLGTTLIILNYILPVVLSSVHNH
jgi:ABC-type transport system involved in cytochrome c biogenesis permease subunit